MADNFFKQMGSPIRNAQANRAASARAKESIDLAMERDGFEGSIIRALKKKYDAAKAENEELKKRNTELEYKIRLLVAEKGDREHAPWQPSKRRKRASSQHSVEPEEEAQDR